MHSRFVHYLLICLFPIYLLRTFLNMHKMKTVNKSLSYWSPPPKRYRLSSPIYLFNLSLRRCWYIISFNSQQWKENSSIPLSTCHLASPLSNLIWILTLSLLLQIKKQNTLQKIINITTTKKHLPQLIITISILFNGCIHIGTMLPNGTISMILEWTKVMTRPRSIPIPMVTFMSLPLNLPRNVLG